MFNNQSVENNAKEKKFQVLFKKWAQDEGKELKSTHYMSGDFFQHVVMQYKESGKHVNELCEMIDLLVRKNLTHRDWIRYDAGDKHEMYSNALAKIFQYTISGYDPAKGTAFVFFTTAIRNAFKEVAKDLYDEKNIAKKILKSRDIGMFIENFAIQDICDFDEVIKDGLEFMSDDEADEVKFEMNEFYTTIAQNWKFDKIKLIEDENAPKFKRQYHTFNCFIPVHDYTEEKFGLDLYANVNKKDFVKFAKSMNVILDVNKDIKELKRLFLHTLSKRAKGIVVEFFDLKVVNEACGTPPSYIQNRAMLVRKLGHQYVGVFSDEWEFKDENGNEIGKKVILRRIQDSYNNMLTESPISNGRYIRYSYIAKEDLNDNNMHPKVWYALDEKREVRHINPDQTAQSYLNWLNAEKNQTRVYDASILKV